MFFVVEPGRDPDARRTRCVSVGVKRLLLFCSLAFVLVSPALAADDVLVRAQRRGERIEVQARALVAAPLAVVWETLTDYEKLPRFIPGIAKSVVVLRQGNRLLLEQAGAARFLFFSFPIEVRLEVIESPQQSVLSSAVAGNVRRMNGRYDLEPDATRGAVLLRYSGDIEPDFDLPPLIGVAALRAMAEEQFTAMVAEIERRAAAKNE